MPRIARFVLLGGLVCISCGGSADAPGDGPGDNGVDASGGASPDPASGGGGGDTGGTNGNSSVGGAVASGGAPEEGSGGADASGGAVGAGGAFVGPIAEDILIATDSGIYCTIVDSETVCWGTTLGGQTTIPVLPNVLALSSDYRIRALTAAGDVYTFRQDYEPPVWEFTVDEVVQLADDGMFLTSDGSVKTVAGNTYALPPGMERVMDAAAVEAVDCYLSADDHAIACSTMYPDASNCEAGDTLREAPGGGFVSLDGGGAHFCAIAEDQSIECWGAGSGVNDAPLEADGSCPVLAGTMVHQGQDQAPAGTFTFVSTGRLHTCAVRTDTTVACWGAGTTEDDCQDPWNACGQSMPPADTGFVQVATGFSNSCGLKLDGTVVCWGSDAGGRSTPPSELQP